MTDLVSPLQAALIAALKGSAEVQAVFGARTNRVYEAVPPDAPTPYLVVDSGESVPVYAEGFDLAEIDVTLHAWSLTTPVGKAEARAFGAAITDAALSLSYDGLQAVEPQRAQYLWDRDGKTAHGVLTFRFTVAPA